MMFFYLPQEAEATRDKLKAMNKAISAVVATAEGIVPLLALFSH
jgi:hypothetical protein